MKLRDRFGNEADISVAEGDFSALLSQCEKRGIPLRKVYFRDDTLKCTLPLTALSAFRQITAECGCYARVECFHGGLYYLKQGYRHRIFIILSLISLLFLLAVLSSVWYCDIKTEKGNSLTAVEEQQILAVIERECGKLPAFKRTLNYDKLAAAITERCPGFAFVGAADAGFALKVTVVKKAKGKALPNVCENVVAKKDGVIRNIFVLRGQPKAEVGETVSRGTILISGTVAYEKEGEETVFRQTAAKGMVTASVWYEGISFVGLREFHPRETGKTAGYIEMNNGKKNYLLWGRYRNPFADSYGFEQKYEFKDVCFKAVTYRETKPAEIRYTEKEALHKAKAEAVKKAKEAIPAGAKIVKVTCTKLTAAAGAVGVRAVVETEEDIGLIREETRE